MTLSALRRVCAKDFSSVERHRRGLTPVAAKDGEMDLFDFDTKGRLKAQRADSESAERTEISRHSPGHEDLFNVNGQPCTCARNTEGYISPYDLLRIQAEAAVNSCRS